MAVVPSAAECSMAVVSAPSGDRKNCMEGGGNRWLKGLCGTHTHTHTRHTHHTHLNRCVKPSVTSVQISPVAMDRTMGQDGSMSIRIWQSSLQGGEVGMGLVQTQAKHCCFNHVQGLTVQRVCEGWMCYAIFKLHRFEPTQGQSYIQPSWPFYNLLHNKLQLLHN